MNILDRPRDCSCQPDGHDPLCGSARLRDTLAYLKTEMLTSVRKHRDCERRFKEITDEYLCKDSPHRAMSQKDKEYQAANDPRRAAATDNAQYHMMRATMFASVIDALS